MKRSCPQPLFAGRVLLALALLSASGAAQQRVECSSVRSAILRRDVRYCAILPAHYEQQKTRHFATLYYLHGLGENEQVLTGPLWNVFEELQKTRTIGEFLIVTPAAGTSFYINSHDGSFRYEAFFIREFIPAIDRKYRTLAGRKSRAISGTSMGGYGALRFAFKYPQLFASVTAQMPALYERFPEQFMPLLGQTARGRQMGDLFGNPFDQKFWQQNTPFTLARRDPAGVRTLRIYFDCGSNDDYGFDAGTRELSRLLTSLHVKHESHIYPGRHDAAYIAAHIGESMMFQSRALGAGASP